MIPTYNRATYLERALTSVLSQDPGPEEMQIEVVDDASTVDDPEALVRQVGGDRVSFFRQPRNLGLVGSWNSCIERSVGEWVHVLHSDDVVFPGFYATVKSALEGRDDIGAAFCRWVMIDEKEARVWTSDLERPTPGVLADFMDKIGVSQRISTPSIVVRRSVYEKLGGFRSELSSTADWEMWARLAARCPIWYEPQILAAWRVHSHSKTALVVKSAENVADDLRCLAVIRPLLPAERAESMSRKARELVSLRALNEASWAWGEGDFAIALRQVREALRCHISLRVMKSLLLLPVRIAQDAARRARARRKK
jgi:glycosyltransferase involved in cell wall biosynthesis